MYPPRGLHTLIVGEIGSGKSQLAGIMYQYAIQFGNKDKRSYPLVEFNCNDYIDDSQQMFAKLFGSSVKSDQSNPPSTHGSECAVKAANGGILFLNEMQKLPSEVLQNIFHIIDSKKYYRKGEVEPSHDADITVIGTISGAIDKIRSSIFREEYLCS